MPDTFEAVTGKLSENETAIGRLYELFGRTFPVDADLWTTLAQEEYQHADWIRQAAEAVTPEQRRQSLLSVRVPAIDNMIRYVGSIAERCARGELTRLNTLILARDLENSLIESKLLGTLSSGAACLVTLQKTLVDATILHRQRIEDALARRKPAG